ncbi:hypothetical protein Spea_1153 [Shewanella pealeana ATCC 700345]|uniref:Uncharacterized protein n=1 Tax=Shewanella pealeana (strain ATCC 700345 / ANG-SQ1) TaxID=398579 RepID=A8H1P3_SHEPA|nr:hypothetical protein Spea_1153 [Shewanella pealeana ATCC 700345]
MWSVQSHSGFSIQGVLMKKWLFPFKLVQRRSGMPERLTQCGFQSPVYCVRCSRYRITISFNHPPCLQGFDFPLNDHIFNVIGIMSHFRLVIVLDVIKLQVREDGSNFRPNSRQTLPIIRGRSHLYFIAVGTLITRKDNNFEH